MPTQEEKEAWQKLKNTFPDRYASFELTFDNYPTGNEIIKYAAYVEIGFVGEYFDTPMQAVDDVIEKVRRKNNALSNH